MASNSPSDHQFAAVHLLQEQSAPRRAPSDVAISDGDRRFLWLLVRCFVHDYPAPATARTLGRAARDTSSWAAVESLLQMHGCSAIAYRLLSQAEVRAAVDPPAETVAWLRSRYLGGLTQIAAEPAIIARQLQALADADVPALVIKGLAVGTWLYADPVVREHGDIDLVVPERHAETVERVLLSGGYIRGSGPYDHPAPFHGPPLVEGESRATVSYLHTGAEPAIDISYDPLRLFWRYDADRDPFDEWWARRQVVTAGGVAFPTLGSEDQFLQLARHLQFHDYSRVIWFVDLLLLLHHHGERLDWRLVGAEAARRGITGGLHRTLTLAEEIYGLRIPKAAWEALRPGTAERLLHRAIWPASRAMPRDRRTRAGNPLSPRMVTIQGGRQAIGVLLLGLDRERRRNLRYLVRRALPPRSWLEAVGRQPDGPPTPYLSLLAHHHSFLSRFIHPRQRRRPRRA